jgi:hypothetical protein
MGTPFAAALAEGASVAHLAALLESALRHGAAELSKPRSGYRQPIVIAFAAEEGRLLAATPVQAALRADPAADTERAFVLAALVIAALVDAGTAAGELWAGDRHGRLVLAVAGSDTELAVLAFSERRVDRLRANAYAVPAGVIAATDLKPPVGANHPLRIAEKVARLGGDPTDPASLAEHEEVVLAAARPHADPDPAMRVARRILQRLDGMGKWGGYHTEFVHLARGFEGNDRGLAHEVGEALLACGLLAEKPSVGQRHVFLNPRRAGDIRRLIESGERPTGLTLPKP